MDGRVEQDSGRKMRQFTLQRVDGTIALTGDSSLRAERHDCHWTRNPCQSTRKTQDQTENAIDGIVVVYVNGV